GVTPGQVVPPHVVVVGGGISGLVAAWELSRLPRPPRVTLLEASGATGGKLQRTEVAGQLVDSGAESLLIRRPEARSLLHDLGVNDAVVAPAVSRARVFSRGRLRPLPGGQVLGVPTDVVSLARSGVLSPLEAWRVTADPVLPAAPLEQDVSVASYVGGCMGSGVVDRLVEPLLGGVYAGHADRLSLQATLPQAWQVATGGGSLLLGLRELQARQARAAAAAAAGASPSAPGPAAGASPSAPGPATGAASPTAGNAGQPPATPFGSLPGGLARLAEILTERVRDAGVDVRLHATVRELRRSGSAWQMVVGETRTPELLEADAVVLALPARPASRLLAPRLPRAAELLHDIEYASVGLVTVAARVEPAALRKLGSGFLVPPVEGRLVKAVTVSSSKWGFYDPPEGLTLLRMSVGRHGEEAVLQRGDRDLARAALADLRELVPGVGEAVETRVTRWGGGLPQYEVGHIARVEAIRAAVAEEPGLAVCGAYLDGVGIPACIGAARAAVARVSASLPAAA
ncbi:MAG: protoporphyrinogen oxidase, partial [Actinomycetales bacterium]